MTFFSTVDLSDLNLKIGKDGYNACPLSMEGFAYMWGGVKATYGVNKGKVAYECKVSKTHWAQIQNKKTLFTHDWQQFWW